VAEVKTQPTGASVMDFLSSTTPVGRREDAYVLLEIMKAASGEDPVMWGPNIVGFGSFHYRYASGHEGDMPVISFSPRKASMSVYGLYYPGYESQLEGLGPYKTGAWCLYLGRFTSLDLTVLRQAVTWAWNDGVPVIAEQISAPK
jgi:hypothetical protein